jgi:MauM/NapG family ferredoxin protein
VTTRTIVQTLCLLFFGILIFLSGATLTGPLPLDLWLRLDPLVSVATPITTRLWLPSLWGGLAVLVLTIVLGRFFCGYMCPLGTTLDLAHHCLPPEKPLDPGKDADSAAGRRRWKYGLLTAILAAAALAIPAAFLAAPIAWATRIYALLVYPLATLTAALGIHLVAPLSDLLFLDDLTYLAPAVPQFAWQLALAVCVLALVGSVKLRPRFWCRYLCPSGALMALFSRRPLMRRRVSADCVQCGTCARRCPMGAIGSDPYDTLHSECITCTTCVQICPQSAVSFGKDYIVPPSAHAAASAIPVDPRDRAARRLILASGLAGAGYAALSLTRLGHLHGRPGPGQLMPSRLLRPPGARPEVDFLARCIRCGLCCQVCPTNTLQPLGLSTGLSGLYSPRVVPRRGACEPRCTACGTVCPTDALRSLPLDEKIWAKIGTARIIPQRCLAWAQGKACLVCDEVCPYDAVSLRRVSGQPVAVPFVDVNRCSGCGYCEHHCPVRADAAIVVGPNEALRLANGSYRHQGRLQGLKLELKGPARKAPSALPPEAEAPLPADALPPGFSD